MPPPRTGTEQWFDAWPWLERAVLVWLVLRSVLTRAWNPSALKAVMTLAACGNLRSVGASYYSIMLCCCMAKELSTSTRTSLFDITCHVFISSVSCFHKQESPEQERSSIYRSLVTNTSKEMMCFSDFPMPPDYPNYLHNTQLMQYFRLYAEHFGLHRYINFQVISVSSCQSFKKIQNISKLLTCLCMFV